MSVLCVSTGSNDPVRSLKGNQQDSSDRFYKMKDSVLYLTFSLNSIQ